MDFSLDGCPTQPPPQKLFPSLCSVPTTFKVCADQRMAGCPRSRSCGRSAHGRLPCTGIERAQTAAAGRHVPIERAQTAAAGCHVPIERAHRCGSSLPCTDRTRTPPRQPAMYRSNAHKLRWQPPYVPDRTRTNCAGSPPCTDRTRTLRWQAAGDRLCARTRCGAGGCRWGRSSQKRADRAAGPRQNRGLSLYTVKLKPEKDRTLSQQATPDCIDPAGQRPARAARRPPRLCGAAIDPRMPRR